MNIWISYTMIIFAFISFNLIFNGLGDHFPKALYIFILNLHADYHPTTCWWFSYSIQTFNFSDLLFPLCPYLIPFQFRPISATSFLPPQSESILLVQLLRFNCHQTVYGINCINPHRFSVCRKSPYSMTLKNDNTQFSSKCD